MAYVKHSVVMCVFFCENRVQIVDTENYLSIGYEVAGIEISKEPSFRTDFIFL